MSIPETLVLDAYGWLQRLRGMAAMYEGKFSSCKDPRFPLDLLGEIVEHIRERWRAESNLREFAGEVQAGLVPAGADFVPPMFAPIVVEIGMDLVRQLDEAKAYMPSGVLPYHHYLLPHPQDNVTVVLERTNELPR